MEIHFCDLCNESVPEADLALGRAVRRGDRVICPVCERAMSGGSAPDGAAEARSSTAGGRNSAPGRAPGAWDGTAQGSPAMGRVPATPKGHGATALTVGLAALLFGAGAAALFSTSLSRERSERLEVDHDQAIEVAHVALRQEQLAQALEAERELLVLDLGRRLAEQARSTSAGLGDLRARLALLDEGLLGVQGSLEALRGDLARSSEDSGRRLDEFAGRLAAQREEGRQVQLQLSELAAAARETPPAPAPDRREEPAWTGFLADLTGTDASRRYYAVIDLAATGDPAVVPHLTPLLGDGDLFVQMATARVLGELGAPAAIEPLIDALEDPQDAVRETAVLALRALTGRNFRFDPFAGAAERSRRVAAWREWWAKARADYL
jgi:hypothetical protein